MKIDPSDPGTYKSLPWTTAITRPKRKRICQMGEDFSIASTKGKKGDYVVLSPRPQLLKQEYLKLHFLSPESKESIQTSTAAKPEDYEFVFETSEAVAYKNDNEFILIAIEDFGKEGIEPLLRMKSDLGLEVLLHLCQKLAADTPGEKHLSGMIEGLKRKNRVGKLRRRNAKAPFAT